MKVKIFDEENERNLEDKINQFINEINSDIIEIKYQIAFAVSGEEQIFCFSAMVIYTE